MLGLRLAWIPDPNISRFTQRYQQVKLGRKITLCLSTQTKIKIIMLPIIVTWIISWTFYELQSCLLNFLSFNSLFLMGSAQLFLLSFGPVFLLLLLSFPLLTIYPNWSVFVCHLDECPGPFHQVQMWGGPDPSWFQESIGVHKGRVNVYPLPWCDTESAQRERKTDLKLGQRSCVRVCVHLCGFWSKTLRMEHKSLSFIHIPATAALLHHRRRGLRLRTVTLPPLLECGAEDAESRPNGNIKRAFRTSSPGSCTPVFRSCWEKNMFFTSEMLLTPC